jgi:D-cysteine desulfhydrase
MKGMHRILLKVHPANKRAFRFYLRQGYSAVDVDQGKLLMQRDIPPPSPPCPTPIEKNGLLDRAGIDLHIKRDDTFPAYGGGSKARQISHILPAILSAGHRAIVTNGGLRSNHARATALACAEAGLPCRLVLHDEGRESSGANGNLLLMKMAGAQIECCRLNELAHRMDTAVSEWVEQGLNPFHLRGAGHCLEGSLAYHAAANEARAQCGEWIPDYVIHASGTGTIQAGLTAGYSGLPTKVIGISVAREKERGLKAVREALIQLGTYLGEDWSQSTLLFRDDWVMGGYEKTSEEVFSVIDEAGRNGLILDPTYTGKAWLGLTRLLAAGEIPPGSKVLFWHTGGVLNLLASPHYLAGKA